ERAVAIIAIQEAGRAFEEPRDTVVMLAELILAAVAMRARPIIHKTADEQVELAVVVVVEPDRARSPARSLQAGLSRYIRECAVAIIPVQNAFAVRRHEQVGPAIVVVIAGCHTHAESSARDAR